MKKDADRRGPVHRLAARQIMVVLELARHREEARCAEAVPRWTRPTWRLRARDERPPGSHVFEDALFSFPPLVVLGAAPVSRTRRQRSLAMRPLSGPPARPDRRSQCEWSTCERCFRAPMLSGLTSRTGRSPFAAPCCRFARCSTRWLTRWRDVRKDRAGAADNARRTARARRWSSGRCGASRQVARLDYSCYRSPAPSHVLPLTLPGPCGARFSLLGGAAPTGCGTRPASACSPGR